jgi:glutamyl-tRNA reductase
MSDTHEGVILVVGVSHQTAGLAARESVALDDPGARRVLHDLARQRGIREAVVLSTCNRTEIYALADSAADGERSLRRALLERSSVGAATLECSAYTLLERDAAEHLIRVASGLESAVLGETEIGGQVRAAAGRALDEGLAGPVLGGLFQRALGAARRVRRTTGISAGATSVGSAVVDLIERATPATIAPRILLIGAGQLASSLAGPLTGIRGAELVIANRTPERSAELAARHAANAIGLDGIDRGLAVATAIVCTTDSPQPVLSARTLERALEGRPRALAIIDLALPRDVEPAVATLRGVSVHDLDAVHDLVGRNLAVRRREADAAAALVRAEAERLQVWRRELDVVPLLRAFWEQAESLRRSELDRASRTLTAEERERLERFSASLVRKLLHGPSERLRAASRTPDVAAHLESLRMLFALADEERPANVVPMPQRGAA